MQFFKKLIQFIREVAADDRIPARDKKVVVALVALLASPLDLIPDWIPLIGQLDDLVVLALLLDYFFNVLDQEILLSHYPWGMKSYIWVRRVARAIAVLTPPPIKRRLWTFQPSPYRGSIS
jgi:uncharacterized membrane protein YkvA (DUF1232 family)